MSQFALTILLLYLYHIIAPLLFLFLLFSVDCIHSGSSKFTHVYFGILGSFYAIVIVSNLETM
jgi:hypothetical protein